MQLLTGLRQKNNMHYTEQQFGRKVTSSYVPAKPDFVQQQCTQVSQGVTDSMQAQEIIGANVLLVTL